MSLAEGETLFMKSPPPPKGSTTAEEYDYFVVAKIDENKIHVTHHTDARPAKARKNPKTGLLEEPRELIALSATAIAGVVSCLRASRRKRFACRLPAYRRRARKRSDSQKRLDRFRRSPPRKPWILGRRSN